MKMTSRKATSCLQLVRLSDSNKGANENDQPTILLKMFHRNLTNPNKKIVMDIGTSAFIFSADWYLCISNPDNLAAQN